MHSFSHQHILHKIFVDLTNIGSEDEFFQQRKDELRNPALHFFGADFPLDFIGNKKFDRINRIKKQAKNPVYPVYPVNPVKKLFPIMSIIHSMYVYEGEHNERSHKA
jgi:hypothetical protein